LLFETDKRFGEDQKTLDISQYSLESSLVMSMGIHGVVTAKGEVVKLRRMSLSDYIFMKRPMSITCNENLMISSNFYFKI
jgi:hypothetical protein